VKLISMTMEDTIKGFTFYDLPCEGIDGRWVERDETGEGVGFVIEPLIRIAACRLIPRVHFFGALGMDFCFLLVDVCH